ncbi:MAG TPA: SCO family protein [Rudaea sp.]|nr:SCO family protein [Rudaea sp.]
MTSRSVCNLLLFVCACVLAPCAFADLPGSSIYRLDVPLVDQDGRAFAFAERAGKPQLVSMFYTSCPYVCPLVIETLKKTQAALTPEQRAKLAVLLVSFDPDRDTPARLGSVFDQRHLDRSTWTLARTDAKNVRKFAAVLDIQFRALATGDINHTSAIVLLAADGTILARTEKLGEADPEFVAAIGHALR